MNQETWSNVDKYFTDLLVPSDPALNAALADTDAAGLPQHNVAPNQGKLLQLLAKICGARTILERWAAIAPFGSRERCPQAGGC